MNVHEAKTHLSRLLERVEAGDEVTIARSGTPIARLVRIEARATRRLGLDAGQVQMGEDFNDPLPEDVLADFER